jgi:glycosyltransferase involved in cell wall biosynthesis
MNILHVTATYYPAVRYGGPIYTVHRLAQALVERGHRVVVYTTNVDGNSRTDIPPGGATILDGVEVHYFPSPFARIYWSPEMIRMLHANAAQFDIVHAHGAFLYPTVAARRASRRAGVAFVYSPRGMFVYDLIKRKNFIGKALWILLFEAANVRAASFVHATSVSEAHDMKRLKLCPNTIHVIANGVDIPSTTSESSEENRRFFDSLRPYVLILGRVNWKKGIDRLIRAMSFVPSTKLAVVGNDDENYTPRLQVLARECGIHDRVVFAGPAYGKDKLAWMQNAELFVLPSHSENFGVAVLEAMGCGCPVIVTPEVGIAEEIGETGAGLVVPGNPEQLSAAIKSLLSDPDRRKKMGEIARIVAQTKYSWSAIAEQMEAAYRLCRRERASAKHEVN